MCIYSRGGMIFSKSPIYFFVFVGAACSHFTACSDDNLVKENLSGVGGLIIVRPLPDVNLNTLFIFCECCKYLNLQSPYVEWKNHRERTPRRKLSHCFKRITLMIQLWFCCRRC